MTSTVRGVVVYFGATPGQPPPPLPGFTWDAESDVTVTYPAAASDHPVESGKKDVTDNVKTMPAMIAVSGYVSATPLYRPSTMPGLNVDGSTFSSDLAVAMQQLLLGYQRERRRVVGATSRGTFPSCVVLNVDVKWGATDGNALAISAQFKQIRVAQQQLVPAIEDADLLAAGATSNGTSTSQSTSIGTWSPNV